ncbi:MAG: thioredoxin family protein [Chitinivibrionales bacterium]|nr:thioredoxin family protein [Chitinivibrionales bacterium]
MKKIQVLGTGCPKCRKLYEASQKVVEENGIDAEIGKVEDLNEIMNFGVMMTPALAIDGNVVVSGKVPSLEELKKLFS